LNKDSPHTIRLLTALWALSESGLGGIMHAFKIPFTGFFLGGFAIIIITLIAHYSSNRFTTIVQATVLVILVKATASPHSPPMAYIAVAFQGFIGALIFQMGFNKIIAILFGGIALLESAIQKFLTATLLFGKSIWEALDGMVNGIAKDLSLSSDFSFSFWLMGIYTGVYVVWGIVVGAWSFGLPKKIETDARSTLMAYAQLNTIKLNNQLEQPKKHKGRKILSIVFILIFIVFVFLVQDGIPRATYAILRTIAALLLLYFIITPISKYLFSKWLNSSKQKHKSNLQQIVDLIPSLKNRVHPAMQLAKQSHSGILVYRQFVVNLIVLGLYSEQNRIGKSSN